MKSKLILVAAIVFFTIGARATEYKRGAMARAGMVYISPDRSSAKLGQIERGREVIILETSREWLHVEANVTEERTITGWMLDKGVVRASTPSGDKILYGEAVDSEDQGSQRRGRRGAGQDGMPPYHPVYDSFPTPPLTAQG